MCCSWVKATRQLWTAMEADGEVQLMHQGISSPAEACHSAVPFQPCLDRLDILEPEELVQVEAEASIVASMNQWSADEGWQGGSGC